jgi:Uma2 family endonuclease
VGRGRESLIAEDGIRGGAPDAVIEIRSPDDETYEKLPFFVALGVAEVIVIDRDAKRVEIYRLIGSQYVALQPDREGWMTSEALDVRLKSGHGSALAIEDRRDSATWVEI